jgi:hypothetical protein
VDIDAVAEGLEGVERDAHRQDEVQQKAVGMAVEEGIGKRLSKEVVVFEKTEDEEVDYYVAPQGPSAELGVLLLLPMTKPEKKLHNEVKAISRRNRQSHQP